MTESGKLGFIGGMELDTTKGKIAGFEEAAKYVSEKEGKEIELLNVPYANSFSDAPKGKEFATELISQGADVFFGDASAIVRPTLAVRYVVALGRRDLLWDLLPEYIEKNVLEVWDG